MIFPSVSVFKKVDFEKYTGKGVKIAVLDSGVDLHHSLLQGKRIFGRSFLCPEENSYSEQSWQDSHGHGTACVGIIAEKAPQADIIVGKIFDTELVTRVKFLCEAIEWAVESRTNIINISAGAFLLSNSEQLEEVCRYAYQNRIMIVAAAHHTGTMSYPSHYPFVFGVLGGIISSKYGFYYRSNHPIELFGCGIWQQVAWIQSQYVFRMGSSFAAPHITGIIALLLEAYPHLSFEQMKELLELNGLPGEPKLFIENNTPASSPCV